MNHSISKEIPIKNLQTNRQSLRGYWNSAMAQKASIAIWRLPNDDTVHFLCDFLSEPKKGRTDFRSSPPGFVISPFVSKEGNETLFLKANLHVTFSQGQSDITISDAVPESFWNSMNETKPNHHPVHYHLNARPDTEISGKKNHFIQMVQDGIKAINNGKFDKVVTARTLDVPLSEHFDVLDQFQRMEKAYPDVFVNFFSIPGRGTWMGATPELLIESSAEHFRTVSLAGTQPFPEDADLSKAAWNQKEIEEQAMVSRYIIEQFKTVRLREFVETGPRTVRAGSMIHLKTEYNVDLNKVHFPELATVMLHMIHPTSAVCGQPKKPSVEFILSNEHLKREFYSGFLGPVNMDGQSCLYVNLRCMQILRTRTVLYAGAGITHDSIPEREWDETALKCQTLLDVMNGNSHRDTPVRRRHAGGENAETNKLKTQ
ncbi:MAG: chorismate-binding protein [Fidelibacterota bacterium]